jgi:DNA processing protein
MLGVGRAGPLGPAALVPLAAARATTGAGVGAGGGIGEREALAVLATAEGVGPITLGRLLATLGSARTVLEVASRGDVALLTRAASGDDRTAPEPTLLALGDVARRAGDVLRSIERAGVELVTLDDADYPTRLRAIEVPPHVLFLRGSRDALSTPRSVAVVGTRRPSENGRLVGARIAGAIARAGAAVLSGLAVGIDGVAHSACLAEGGVTVAVLGGGHERLSPMAHRRLAEAIVERGGAVVSELAPEVEPTIGTFPRRNRVISGLADATIVVEAGARSGALLTAHWAMEQGRDCFVVPGPIDRPQSAGCLSLLRAAAGVVRVVAGVPQLLEDLDLVDPPPSGVATDAASALSELGEVPRRIAAELLRGHSTVDEIVAVTRLPVATVLTALTLLERRGLVVDAYGRYRPSGHLATRPQAVRRARKGG